jgi:phytoene dehydrogenase-like protein
MGGKVYDAVVVGSGPNGLAAAITLAREGLSVLVLEAQPTPGGGVRSAELTRPGFTHDVGAAVFAFVPASPLFRGLPLAAHGLELIQPPTPLAHPLDDGTAVLLERSVAETCETLGPDARAYRRLVNPLVHDADSLFADLLGPIRVPSHPAAVLRFAWRAAGSIWGLAGRWFEGERGPALLAGLAAHANLPLEKWPTAAIGLMLGIAAHVGGWPIARGGSQRLTDALIAVLRSLGGELEIGRTVRTLDDLPPARAILLDLTPRQVVQVAGARLPQAYSRGLALYRYGPGVFKMDWALKAPIPWRAAACSRAGVVHVGGTIDEIAASEAAVCRGELPERPFVLLTQPSLFDATRAPPGNHTAWAYCHVPLGSPFDMADRIEGQIERFAPGFGDVIEARSALGPAALEDRNANLVGGDISGGTTDLRQFLARPVARLRPYVTPVPGLYLCSSSTPPGVGVHGACGYYAAGSVLRRSFGRRLRSTP